MALALVAHAPPSSDRLHLWVGAADVSASPTLAWKRDGNSIDPMTLRPLAPALTTAADTTVYTGFFEYTGLAPDTLYRIELSSAGERIVRTVRTLPAAVPTGPQDRFNVLLLSCFHRLEDKTGTAGRVLSRLEVKPQLALYAGDQVYLDLPTLMDFQDNVAWLGNKFQNDYLNNWVGDRQARVDPAAIPPGYPQVLALAPGAFMPDDHEFWNNYPFWAGPVQNSWTAAGRDRWRQAAVAAYRGFQQTGADVFGGSRTIEVAPLSILLLDTRSQRTDGSLTQLNDLLGASGRQALRRWADRLVQSAGTPSPRFGILVTGQSLFSPPAGELKGAITDYELPDYAADYAFMVGELERLTRAGLPVILATGDVHWGRVLSAVDPGSPGAPVFEVISSPTSLVSTVIMDQAKEVWGAIKGLFGAHDPWPRHSDPDRPPPRFGSSKQYHTTVLTRDGGGDTPAAMRGNQAFMLRFARSAGGLDVEVTCYPLATDDTFNAREQWTSGFRLRPPRGV